ncbi:MAG: cupin domain-containing protein [Erythrobacter sp.]
MTEVRHASLADIIAEIDRLPADARFTYPIRNGTMRAGVYAPRDRDTQTPHDQDEIYIIASGCGRFELSGKQIPFAPGDILFVKAGEPHCFVQFTSDFATWVMFWGERGGEG